MNELEDKINRILADPTQMEKLAGLAQSLMGGGGAGALPSGGAQAPPPFDPGMLQKLSRAMNGSGGESSGQALLRAMEPWLSEKRRGKVDRALRLARLAKLAQVFLGEAGGGEGDGHVPL